MENIETLNDLLKLDEKCVVVNMEFFNYMYYIFITSCDFDESIYELFNKYIKTKFQEEYITHRCSQTIVMNPVELKLLIEYTHSEQYISEYVKPIKKSVQKLIDESLDIDERFRKKRFSEYGTVIKSYEVLVKQPKEEKKEDEDLIDQITSKISSQSRVSDIVESAKGLKLKP